MDNERTAVITIGDEEYTLLLTTKLPRKSPVAMAVWKPRREADEVREL